MDIYQRKLSNDRKIFKFYEFTFKKLQKRH